MEWQRTFPLIEEDTEYIYTALIRLKRTYEGFGEWQILVDISNDSKPGRVIQERNDKLPRLPQDFEADTQKELIDAAVQDINSMTTEELDHPEKRKIGFKGRQDFVKWHLLPEE